MPAQRTSWILLSDRPRVTAGIWRDVVGFIQVFRDGDRWIQLNLDGTRLAVADHAEGFDRLGDYRP